MINFHGRFVWYELITTEAEAAKALYGKVMGWGVLDVSVPNRAYTLFTAGNDLVSGLMDLPKEGQRTGKPAWIGYIGVDDVDATAGRIRGLGGTVHVPLTDVINVSRFSIFADPQTARLGLLRWARPPLQKPAGLSTIGQVGWHEFLASDRQKARQGMLGAMGNPYGITLDEASLRWAAAEGVPESVIAAICLLDEKSVDEIVAKLSPVELEQVIKIVGRSPRGYAPGAYDALKGERHRRSTEPPAQRLSPKAAAKEQAGRVREDTDRLRGGHTRRPMGLSADGRQSAAERGADALKGKRNLASLQPPSERLSPNVALKPGQPAHTNSGAERSRRIHVRRFTAPRLEVPQHLPSVALLQLSPWPPVRADVLNVPLHALRAARASCEAGIPVRGPKAAIRVRH